MVHHRYMLSIILLLSCLAYLLHGDHYVFAEVQGKASDIKSKTITDGLEAIAIKRDKSGIVHIDQSTASKLLLSKPDKRSFNGMLIAKSIKQLQSFIIK